MPTSDPLVSYLHKHVIPLVLTLRKGKDKQKVVITTFVLSISEKWFLITAGHCISCIQDLTDKKGYEIEFCEFHDSLGMGATHPEPYSYPYKMLNPICLSDNLGFDYGILHIPLIVKEALRANRVEALNENTWKTQPTKVDYYKLLGIPSELVKFTPEHIQISSALITVEPLNQKPEIFTEVNVPLFYGQLTLGEGLNSIKGMSGGPIFGFEDNGERGFRYWLIALQSRWTPETHYIAACPTTLLGQFLELVYLQSPE